MRPPKWGRQTPLDDGKVTWPLGKWQDGTSEEMKERYLSASNATPWDAPKERKAGTWRDAAHLCSQQHRANSQEAEAARSPGRLDG